MRSTGRRSKILALAIVASGIFVAVAFAIQLPRTVSTLSGEATLATSAHEDTGAAAVPLTSAGKLKNLTETLIQTYAKEIADRNQDGLKAAENGKSGISLPDKQAIEDLLAEKLQAEFQVTLLTTTDLKKTADSSPESVRAYLTAIRDASAKRFPGGMPNDLAAAGPWITSRNGANLFAATDALEGFVADLKNIPAPETLMDFHLGFTNLEVKRLTIYRALLAMDEDPLQATLAADLIDKLSAEEIALRTQLTLKLGSS